MFTRLRTAFPRPTRTTLVLVVLAVVAALAIHFLVARPAQNDKEASVVRERELVAERQESTKILQDYRSGEVLTGQELESRVVPLDTLLPQETNVPPIDLPRQLATQRGLVVTAYNFSANYTPTGPPYPDMATASGTMTVTGDPADIISLLRDFEAQPQLVTYTIEGIDEGSATLDVWLWASKLPPFTL